MNDEGEDHIWDDHYANNGEDEDGVEGEFVDMSSLVGVSSATEVDLRGTRISSHILPDIMRMVPHLEKIRVEQYYDIDYFKLSQVVRNPSPRRLAFVEYDLADEIRDHAWSSFNSLGSLHPLTHVELPI